MRKSHDLQLHLEESQTLANELAHSQQQLISFTDALSTYTVMLSVTGKVELVNKTTIASTGLSSEELIGRGLHECYWWDYSKESQDAIKVAIGQCAKGECIDQEVKIRIVKDQFIFIRLILTPVKDVNGVVTYLVAEGQDITARKRATEKLTFQASHDSLTGLINRVEFENRLNQLLSRGASDETHFVFYMNLDQFKIVNDTCGHTAGDELLRQIPACIKPCIRRSDVLARLGGDEFGLILERCEQNVALNIAKAIIRSVSDLQFCWEDKSFRVGVSIGMLALNDDMTDIDDVLKHIDLACYAAKDAGRNCYHLYKQDDKRLQRRAMEMDWVTRLEQAINENRLELFAQSIVSVDSNVESCKNYELLVRMRDDDNNIIPPGAFLPSAERYHKMTAIDRWVVSKAISLLASNPAFVSQIGYCSVNISCQSLTDRSFLTFLIDQLSDHDGLSEKFCIEITETAAISNLSQAMKFITILRGTGVRFALDDFGSGLSSFAYLKTLPVDYLKIDGMFVRDIVDDKMDSAMVKSIHDVATVMGLKTIAEFVENDDILYKIGEIGIDYAQGYGIDKPQPFTEVIERVIKQADEKIILLANHQ